MRISDWSSDVCSSDLRGASSTIGESPDGNRTKAHLLPRRQRFGRSGNRNLDHLIAFKQPRVDLRHRPCAKDMLDPCRKRRFLFLGEHKLVLPDKGGGVPLPTGVHAIANRQFAHPDTAIDPTPLQAVASPP